MKYATACLRSQTCQILACVFLSYVKLGYTYSWMVFFGELLLVVDEPGCGFEGFLHFSGGGRAQGARGHHAPHESDLHLGLEAMEGNLLAFGGDKLEHVRLAVANAT